MTTTSDAAVNLLDASTIENQDGEGCRHAGLHFKIGLRQKTVTMNHGAWFKETQYKFFYRHAGESQHPVNNGFDWILAYARMTI